MKNGFMAGMLVFLLFSSAAAALKFGESAPVFSLRDMEGNLFNLSDVVGPGSKDKARGVILTFFASWCGPCKKELPLLNAIANEYAGKGIKVVLVNVKETNKVVVKLLRDLRVERPVVLGDQDGEVSGRYGVWFLPTTYFIGADGGVRDVIFGGARDSYELRKSAEKLLK